MTTTETKDRILDTAERLFARDGFGATSLREITKEAAVNIAAVNYHFGSKEGLIAAVMERRLRPINDQRIAALSALHEHHKGGAPPVRDLLRAFLTPPFQKLHDWKEDDAKSFAILISRVHYEANPDVRETILHDFKHVLDQFRDALRRGQPGLPTDRLNARLLFVVGAMAYTLAWLESPEVLNVSSDQTSLLEELIAFAAGGVTAPCPEREPQ